MAMFGIVAVSRPGTTRCFQIVLFFANLHRAFCDLCGKFWFRFSFVFLRVRCGANLKFFHFLRNYLTDLPCRVLNSRVFACIRGPMVLISVHQRESAVKKVFGCGSAASCFLLTVFLVSPAASAQPSPQANADVTSIHNRHPAASTTTAYTLPPDKLVKAKALYDFSIRLRIVESIYSFLVLVALLLFRTTTRYRVWAEAVSKLRFVQALVFVPLLMFTISLLLLPLRIYGHHVSLSYGLSIEKWGPWFVDFFQGEALTSGLLVVILWLLILIIRKSPKLWWFYAWLVAVPILVFLTFAAPLVFDRIFNNFEPLDRKHPELTEAIEKLVQRGGLSIPQSRIYEMDASRRYTTLNAYVTGFGASKRVVVWDTTIQKLTTPETLAVFGHEMGHYVLHHIIYGMIAAAIGLLIGLYLVYRVSDWALGLFQQRSGIRELSDWAAAPVILLLFGVLGFFAEPIGNTISREIEHQADVYGLEITYGAVPDSQEAAAHSFQVLGELSLDYPYPSKWVVVWFYDHPAISDRVRFASEYDPWGKGEKPRYVSK